MTSCNYHHDLIADGVALNFFGRIEVLRWYFNDFFITVGVKQCAHDWFVEETGQLKELDCTQHLAKKDDQNQKFSPVLFQVNSYCSNHQLLKFAVLVTILVFVICWCGIGSSSAEMIKHMTVFYFLAHRLSDRTGMFKNRLNKKLWLYGGIIFRQVSNK